MACGAAIAAVVGATALAAPAPAKQDVEQHDVRIVAATVKKGEPRLFRLKGPTILGPFKLAKGKQKLVVRWKLKANQRYYFMLQGAAAFKKDPGDLATTHQLIGVSGPKDQVVDIDPVLDVGGLYQGKPLPAGDYYLAMGEGDADCRWLVCLDKACMKVQP